MPFWLVVSRRRRRWLRLLTRKVDFSRRRSGTRLYKAVAQVRSHCSRKFPRAHLHQHRPPETQWQKAPLAPISGLHRSGSSGWRWRRSRKCASAS